MVNILDAVGSRELIQVIIIYLLTYLYLINYFLIVNFKLVVLFHYPYILLFYLFLLQNFQLRSPSVSQAQFQYASTSS